MDAEPQWFGQAPRSLFGWVHRPAGSVVRAAVVLCPSMGQEYTSAHYTLRSLAVELASLGFLVVRFDYDGTGDSLGGGDAPGRLQAWLGSVDDAIDLARSHTSAPLVLVGLRVGALLSVTAAGRRGDVSALVLWDSPRSGASYVREQRTRQNIALGDAVDAVDNFLGMGLDFTPETLDELRTIDVRGLGQVPADRALAVVRPGQRLFAPGTSTRSGAPVTMLSAPDQDDLLYRQTPPVETEREVLRWFDHAFETPPTEPVAPTVDAVPSSTPGQAAGRTRLELPGSTETIVSLGPNGLFGIRSEPRQPVSRTLVMFVPEFFTPHSGMMRVWTELARELGSQGIATLRFDVSGCGDSPARPGLQGHRWGIVEHIDDVRDAMVASLGEHADESVLIGLCSGAYLAAETALDLRTRGIILINPVFAFITPEQPASPRRQALGLTRPALTRLLGPVAGRLARRLVRPDNAPVMTRDPSFDWSRTLEAGYWRNLLYRRAPWLPEWFWVVTTRVFFSRLPHQVFRRVRKQGTQILFVAGDGDWEYTWLGSRRAMRSLEAQGGVELQHIPSLDHSMLGPGMKQLVKGLLTSHVKRILQDETPGGRAGPTRRRDRGARARGPATPGSVQPLTRRP